MAVITKFFIVRNGVELDKVFDNKKLAEAYDKMLDAAENLAAFINQSDFEIDMDPKTVSEISIYLAKNAPEVTKILKGIRPVELSAPERTDTEKSSEASPDKAKNPLQKKSKTSAKK